MLKILGKVKNVKNDQNLKMLRTDRPTEQGVESRAHD